MEPIPKILIVDDEPDMLNMLKLVVKKQNNKMMERCSATIYCSNETTMVNTPFILTTY